MDRISDSGSDGCGSIPHGSTKKISAFRRFFRTPMRNRLSHKADAQAIIPYNMGSAPSPAAFGRAPEGA